MSRIPAAQVPNDTDVARGVALRDPRAVESMMRRHNRMLFRLARSILKNDAEAEDAVQEPYLIALRSIGGFRGGAQLGTWLGRIVINEAYGRLRRAKRTSVVLFDPSERRAEADLADEAVDRPEAAAMREELRRLLERKIDKL